MAEPILSPIGRSINAIRRRFSASTFMPPQGGSGANQQVDPELTRIIIRNTNAVNTVTTQLTSVATQVNSLTQSLAAISQSLALSSRLEEQRINAEANRQRQLATLALREGKEGEIERKITNAALAPVQLISKKALGVLNRLTNFFTTVFLGWLSSKSLDTLQAYIGGNDDLVKQLKDEIIKGLLIIGTLAIGLQVLATVAVLGLKSLAKKLGGLAISNLIKKPLTSLANFFRARAGAPLFGGGFRNVTKNKVPPTGAVKTIPMFSKIGNFLKSKAFPASALTAVDVIQGKSVAGAAIDNTAGVTAGALTRKLPIKNPLVKTALTIGSFLGVKGITEQSRLNLLNKFNLGEGEDQKEEQTDFRTDVSSNVDEKSRYDISGVTGIDDNKPKGNGFMRGLAGTADFFTGNLFDFDKQNDSNLVKATTNKKDLNKQSNLQLQEPAPQVVDMSMGGNNQGQTTRPPSSSGIGGIGGSVPRIPANNNNNNYVYSGYREYQIAPV